MPRVNLLKRIKTDGAWVLRSIPREPSGGYDWGALPDGRYFIEWYEAGKRLPAKAGVTVAQARGEYLRLYGQASAQIANAHETRQWDRNPPLQKPLWPNRHPRRTAMRQALYGCGERQAFPAVSLSGLRNALFLCAARARAALQLVSWRRIASSLKVIAFC